MTIVKPSSKIFSRKRPSAAAKNSEPADVFSDSHLPGISRGNEYNAVESCDGEEEEESIGYNPNTQKEDLQDLFAAIQSRLKKKTINQKKAMEMELKKTISRTVAEMNQKIEIAKNHIDLKLRDMKSELEKIQRDQEGHLKSIKAEYEQFQHLMQKAIDKIDTGEKKINVIRDRFLNEIISFNRDFDFPKEKVEELFNAALIEVKNKASRYI